VRSSGDAALERRAELRCTSYTLWDLWIDVSESYPHPHPHSFPESVDGVEVAGVAGVADPDQRGIDTCDPSAEEEGG
jgi:hypothetical protein